LNVLIVGAGEMGFHLAQRLSQENQDVILIESDPDRARNAQDHLDVLTVARISNPSFWGGWRRNRRGVVS